MPFALDQVIEMAPDPQSVESGKKLLSLRYWKALGLSPRAVWGMCQGSRVYQVRVDLENFGYRCNCPSRKFPCRHVLGLLMLLATNPDAISDSEPPEWVTDWLEKRRQREKTRGAGDRRPKKSVDEKARKRRANQRESRVRDGVESLNVWLEDLIRNGLAGLEARPYSFWEEQAKRLVDAQASGLAGRVRRLAEIPGSARDWPQRLLNELGRLKLLLHAYQRIDDLEPNLQTEIRQLIGWNVTQQDLQEFDDTVVDDWFVFAQRVDEDDRFRSQRSWVIGRNSDRTGLILQFTRGAQPFPEQIVPGMVQRASLVFYPGVSRLRARFVERNDAMEPVSGRFPGVASLDEMLDDFAGRLAQHPWLANCGYVLQDVSIVLTEAGWLVRDVTGKAVPLGMRDHWKLLAITGGREFDLTGEWTGNVFLPLAFVVNGQFRSI